LTKNVIETRKCYRSTKLYNSVCTKETK